MNKITEIIKVVEEKLQKYSPVTIDYGKDKVTGFINEINGNDLVIYYKKDEMVMTFGFQNAHFAIDDVDSLIIHTEKYLTSEYSSVEFFEKTKDLFGGSRLSSTVDFSSVESIVECYSCGIETAKEGLYNLIKRKTLTVRAINFDNTINKVANISYKDGEYILQNIRG